jgi:hypothetical protein
MTPKEKAKELVEKFMPFIAGADRYNTTLGIYDIDISKQCALIAVDEILNNDGFTQFDIYLTEYWQEVKQEIICQIGIN